MRAIDGYVFVAEVEAGERGIQHMLGKPIDKEQIKIVYCNINLDEIAPYENEILMRERMKSCFVRNDIKRVSPSKLLMKIAETSKEADFFRKEDNLVAVRIERDFSYLFYTLFGEPVINSDGSMRILLSSSLSENGITPFRIEKDGDENFKKAMEARGAISRQGDLCPTLLATFNLQKLKGEVIRK